MSNIVAVTSRFPPPRYGCMKQIQSQHEYEVASQRYQYHHGDFKCHFYFFYIVVLHNFFDLYMPQKYIAGY